MGLNIKRMEDIEEEWFLKMEMKTVYSHLSRETMLRWINGDFYKAFILGNDEENQKIGGVSFDIYDFLNNGKGGKIILDTDIFFVDPEYQGKGYGRYVLEKIFSLVKELYYRENGLNVVAVLIESNTASGFYKKVLDSMGYSYQDLSQEIAGTEIRYLLVDIENI